MKILLVGCSASVDNLRQFLESECLIVSVAETQDEALELINLYAFDALVTELRLLQGSGDKLVSILRNDKKAIPILVLYPEVKQVPTLAELLDMGADDAMRVSTGKTDRMELSARIRSIVRRAKGYACSTVEVGALALDLESKTLRINGKTVRSIGNKQLSILEFFMLRVGRSISRVQIIEGCWGDSANIDERTVDVHVGKLRKAIASKSQGSVDCEKYILTVHGYGYVLEAPKE